MNREQEAAAAGIDTRVNVRQGLIELREKFLSQPSPAWDTVALLSHAIWWLADDNG